MAFKLVTTIPSLDDPTLSKSAKTGLSLFLKQASEAQQRFKDASLTFASDSTTLANVKKTAQSFEAGGEEFQSFLSGFNLELAEKASKKLGITGSQLLTNPQLLDDPEALAKFTGQTPEQLQAVAEAGKNLSPTFTTPSGAVIDRATNQIISGPTQQGKTSGTQAPGQQGVLGGIQTGISDVSQQIQALLQKIAQEGITGPGGQQLVAPTTGATGTSPPPTTQTALTGQSGGAGGISDQLLKDLQEQIKAIQDTLVSGLNPTEKEQQIQKQLDNILAGAKLGIADVKDQPIATPFITGQAAAIQTSALAQAVPLEQQLGRLQAKRQGALDVATTKLGFIQDKFELLKQEIKEQAKTTKETALQKDTVQAIIENPQLFNQLTSSQKTILIPQLTKAGFTFPKQEPSTKFTSTQTNKLEQAGLSDAPKDKQLDFLFGQTPEEQDKKDVENLIKQVSVGGGSIQNAKQVLRGGGFDPSNFTKELENIYGVAQVREATFQDAREDLQIFKTKDINPNTIFTQVQQEYGKDLTNSEITALMNEAGYFKIAGQWIQQF